MKAIRTIAAAALVVTATGCQDLLVNNLNSPDIDRVFRTPASIEAIGRYSGFYLIAHNAFVDELTANGALGLSALIGSLLTAGRVTWRNARAGFPAGFSLVLALAAYAVFQGIDYSLQLSIIGLVILLETHCRLAREGRRDV